MLWCRLRPKHAPGGTQIEPQAVPDGGLRRARRSKADHRKNGFHGVCTRQCGHWSGKRTTLALPDLACNRFAVRSAESVGGLILGSHCVHAKRGPRSQSRPVPVPRSDESRPALFSFPEPPLDAATRHLTPLAANRSCFPCTLTGFRVR